MVDIKKIQTPPITRGLEVPDEKIEERPSETWEFRRGAFTFNFMDGKILMNQQDLSKLISENLRNLATAYWTQVARRLEEYRQWVLRHISDPEQLAMFAAMMYSLLNKIEGRVKKKYDETIDGVAFYLEDGQLLLNGINVSAFVQMAGKHPTKKAKVFLKGLKNRLALMLSNRFGNPNYERIRSVIEELSAEIDKELSKPMNDVIYLPPKSGERL